MKRLFTFVICAVFVLASCSRVENEGRTSNVSTEEMTIYSDSMFILDEKERNKFIKLYEEALKVYRWFNYSTMELNYERPFISDKEEYEHLYEIKDNALSTMNELRNYVSNYFSKELVDELLDNQQLYTEVDGKLYGRAADRGSDITKGEREVYKLIKIDEQNYVFRVEVDIVDPENRMNVIGLHIVDYPITVVNNNYVFTQFEDIR